MRTLRIFLPLLVVAGAALLLVEPSRRPPAELPSEAPLALGEPVLDGADLADAEGRAPFTARVHRLEDIRFRLVEDGYVRAYLQLGRLARGGSGLEMEGVTGGIFDPPEGGQPRLRFNLEAPRVTGDSTALLRGGDEAPKAVVLEGGVVARDPSGRAVLETERLRVDLEARTLSTAAAVSLRDPEHGLAVEATGLDAALDLRRARLDRDVVATLRRGGTSYELAGGGPAVLEEDAKSGEVRLSLEGGARLRHPLGTATCRNLHAVLRKVADGRYELSEATLEGGVEVALDPRSSGGLEGIRAPRVVVEGDEVVRCDGPLEAVRRGPLPAFGMGERILDIEAAGGAVLLLQRGAADVVELREIRFPGGLRAADRAGAGRFHAGMLTFVREGSVVEAFDVTEAITPEGSLRAAFLRARGREAGFEVWLEGEKRVHRFGETPLGGAPRGTVDLTCTGPLHVVRADDRVTFDAQGRVVARLEDQSRLEGGRVRVEVAGKKPARLSAEDGFLLRDQARSAEITGDALVFEGGAARASGSPARASLPGGRSVQARALLLTESRAFEAEGDVVVEGPLSSQSAAAPWSIRCGRAAGTLAEKGPPVAVRVDGGLDATGPEGQRIEGETLVYDGLKETVRLRGKPARLARGDDLRLVAPGFDLDFKGGDLAVARTAGAAVVDVVPKDGGGAGGDLTRWRIELKGPARLAGSLLTVPKGARLVGYDRHDRPVLEAEANRVEVAIERDGKAWSARELRAGGGVVVASLGKKPARVVADRLAYVPGTRRIDVFGGAEVVADGWPATVRFEHVVFVPTKDGVDLKRASGVAVESKE